MMIVDKTNVDFMKEYLEHVIDFEKNVYIWSNAVRTANEQVEKLESRKSNLEYELRDTESTLCVLDEEASRTIQYKQKEIERCQKVLKKKKRPIIVIVCLWLISALLGYLAAGPLAALAISMLFGVILIVVQSFRVSGGDGYVEERTVAKYTDDLKNNTEENQARRKKVLLSARVKELKEANQHTDIQILNANSKQIKVSDALDQARRTLSEIYALDILPSKYRSLNAAATLYEYLDTGRCTIIQGHGGIYDTYEYDLKLGLIVSKLDEIIDCLDRIEDRQRRLYDEMHSVKKSLSSINKEICTFNSTFSDYAVTSLEIQKQQAATVQWAAWNQWASGKM